MLLCCCPFTRHYCGSAHVLLHTKSRVPSSYWLQLSNNRPFSGRALRMLHYHAEIIIHLQQQRTRKSHKKSLQACRVGPLEGDSKSRVLFLLKCCFSCYIVWPDGIEKEMNKSLKSENWMRPMLDHSTCSELWRSLSEDEGHCTPLGSGRVDRELPLLAPWIPDSKAAHTENKLFVNLYMYPIPSVPAMINQSSIINPQTAKCRPPNATQQNTAFLFYNKYLVIVGDRKDRTDKIKNGENEPEEEAMGA